MAEIDYGRDRSCTTDIDPMLRFVTGTELMGQICVRRLSVRSGSLLSNPVDNTIDARDFLSQGIAEKDLPRIQGVCAAAILGDQRIFTCTVAATFDTSSRTLTLRINGTGAGGSFFQVVAITAVTIELLRP
jgi:hypothetical protein